MSGTKSPRAKLSEADKAKRLDRCVVALRTGTDLDLLKERFHYGEIEAAKKLVAGQVGRGVWHAARPMWNA